MKTKDAGRVDSGTYKIVATNESGKDEAEVEVVVLGEGSLKFFLKHYLNITTDVNISVESPEGFL